MTTEQKSTIKRELEKEDGIHLILDDPDYPIPLAFQLTPQPYYLNFFRLPPPLPIPNFNLEYEYFAIEDAIKSHTDDSDFKSFATGKIGSIQTLIEHAIKMHGEGTISQLFERLIHRIKQAKNRSDFIFNLSVSDHNQQETSDSGRTSRISSSEETLLVKRKVFVPTNFYSDRMGKKEEKAKLPPMKRFKP